jgi:uncharacterized membrane protein
MISPEKELEILERISRSKTTIRQRDLAQIIGLSLGMTNAILKRLASKGLLQIKKVNNRNIHYVVSTKGMEAIASRSYGYLKRTIKNVVYYKEAIGNVLQEAADRGYQRIVLTGSSDLGFIVEHFCAKKKLLFSHRADASKDAVTSADTFVLFSENSPVPENEAENTDSLRRLFMARPQSSVAPPE